MKRRIFIVWALILFRAAQGETPEDASAARPGVHVRGFADDLFERREFYRAITEYERYLYLAPEAEDAPQVRLQLARAYHFGGHPGDAREEVRSLMEAHPESRDARYATLLVAATHRVEENPGLAAMSLETFYLDHRHREEGQVAGLLAAVEFLRADEPETAREVLGDVSVSPTLKEEAEKLRTDVEAYEALQLKNPKVAGALSAAVPGAGQLYTGNRGDAFVAFLLNGVLIYATYEAFDREQYVTGSLLATIESGWYLGNIYNAVNGAHKVNRRRKRRFVEQLDLRLAPLWMTEESRLGLGALYRF